MKFSERAGFKPICETIQINGINKDLRNSLWNILDLLIWSDGYFLYSSGGHLGEIDFFSKELWFNFFKLPIDTRPSYGHKILEKVRKFFFSCEWYDVYDFIEFLLSSQFLSEREKPKINSSELNIHLNIILERELAGYRVVSGKVVNITDKQEIQMLEKSISCKQFEGVQRHLKRSLELLSDRKQPDYRNSIKESISAVESMAQVITNKPKATLGDALKILEKKKGLHSSLKGGFSKLYGYTSNKDGIRHGMLEEPNITVSEAKFFLLSCTSFINYLKSFL